MKYEEFKWEGRGFIVVYGASAEQRDAFADTFARCNPQYRTKIFDFIVNYKKGFLRKERTILELLLEKTPKSRRAEVERQYRHQMDAMGLSEYQYRRPHSMGSGTVYMWTILFDALWGCRYFLIRDDGSDGSKERALRTARWLQQFDPNLSVVWLTGCPEEKLMDPILPNEDANYFWYAFRMLRLENGGLTPIDKQALAAELQEMHARELERLAALMAEKLQAAKELEQADRHAEALAAYEALGAEGSEEAMYRAARLYFAGKGSGTRSDQDKTAESLCRRAGTAEAWILLGDHIMDKMKLYEEKDLTKTEKKIAVGYLLEARVCYANAAEQDSAKGCLKAARLHLQYSFRRWTDNPYNQGYNESYSRLSAIPYIKRLLAMRDSGRFVHLELLELQLLNGEIYERAETQYNIEKQ